MGSQFQRRFLMNYATRSRLYKKQVYKKLSTKHPEIKETLRTTGKQSRNIRTFCDIFHSFGNPFFLDGFNWCPLQYFQCAKPNGDCKRKRCPFSIRTKLSFIVLIVTAIFFNDLRSF